MEEEYEVITLQDDDGNELELIIVDEFAYDGKRYALLAEPDSDDEADGYLMRIEEDGEDEVFLSVEPDEFEKVSEYWLNERVDLDDEDDEDEDEIPL